MFKALAGLLFFLLLVGNLAVLAMAVLAGHGLTPFIFCWAISSTAIVTVLAVLSWLGYWRIRLLEAKTS